ncbi:energy-coupling factor transport system ATP-binding protein [Lachnospiraceae bacterium XBB1006]|nr:energy-coupling factor transport system ATP-binding protein [Lachnospiraceae bacterium XBB1006]
MSLILNHVNYVYEPNTPMERMALRDINLTIEAGEFVGIIGHTGSGKSTLIQQLNGLMKPTYGEVYFHGRDIYDGDFSLKELRSKVGLVFQYPEYQLFETTVFEDVCFGPKNLGLSEKEAGLRAFEALEYVKIPKELFYQSPFELSGGQKRRVAIAGVLAMRPEVLILDEPTAGLDPQGREELLGELRRLNEGKGMTIILVSHSMEDVANYVQRLIVMEDGGIRFDGTPKDVFAHCDELEELGLMAPQVTYLMRELQAKGFPVEGNVTTVDEAKKSILRAISWQNRMRPC